MANGSSDKNYPSEEQNSNIQKKIIKPAINQINIAKNSDSYKERQQFYNKKNLQQNNEMRQHEHKPQKFEKRIPHFKDFKHNHSLISVVIPLYNEEDSLPELSLQLQSELNRFAKDRWEVIFVDDGSTDKSFSVLKDIHNRNPKFKALRFRRNFGKSAALAAGFAESKGVIIITMDADLQDDPAEIPNLVNKIKEGWDLVSGWKRKRHDPITKKIPSKFFNFVTSICSGLKLHDFNCGLKAYRHEVIKSISVYGEMHRYIPALAKWEGFKITEIPVMHHPRRYGKSKFGFSRFMKGFLDLTSVMFTTRFFKRPLHFFGTLGTLIALIGLGIDIYLTVEWFLGNTFLTNRPLALLGIALIIVGVQLFSFGLIGEMITKYSLEKMNYSIQEKL